MSNELQNGLILGIGVPIILAVLLKWVWPATKRFWQRTWQRVMNILPEIFRDVVREELRPIKAELELNHGKSLKDLVLAMKHNQAEILDSLNCHAAREWALRGIDRKECASFVTDKEGKLIRISRQIQWWTGRGEDELMGSRWVSIIWPADRDAVAQWWQATWTGASYGEMEQRYIRYDQKPFRVKVIAEPVISAGNYVGHVGEIIPLDSWDGRSAEN